MTQKIPSAFQGTREERKLTQESWSDYQLQGPSTPAQRKSTWQKKARGDGEAVPVPQKVGRPQDPNQ